jgi:hypothetical protein
MVGLLGLTACDSTTGPGDEPALHLRVITEETALGSDGVSLEDEMVIRVVDAQGTPCPGVDVQFTISQGDGTLTHGSDSGRVLLVPTDQSGYAAFGWRLDIAAPNYVEAATRHSLADDGPAVIRALVRDDSTVVILGFHWFVSEEYVFPHVEGLHVPYDPRILESRTFLTFTDASSDLVRLNFASWAEEAWSEILAAMEVSRDYIRMRDREDKVWIYTKKTDDYGRQYTFNYGFLIYGIDSPAYNRWGEASRLRHPLEIAHEVMHMVQYKMGVPYQACDDWFMEGIAEHVSGGAFAPITTSAELEAWIDAPYHNVNPIDIRSTADYPEPYLQTSGTYYPLFHLVLDYLLSEQGHGRTFVDARHVLEDIAQGSQFTTAFEHHFEIDIGYLRDNLYTLLRGYVGG